MGGLARDPLLPHAYLLGGCVSGGWGVRRYTLEKGAPLAPGGKKGGAVGAMSPAHYLSKPGGGGGGWGVSHTRTGPGRPPGPWPSRDRHLDRGRGWGGGGVQRPRKISCTSNRPPVSGPFGKLENVIKKLKNKKFHFFPEEVVGGGVRWRSPGGYSAPSPRTESCGVPATRASTRQHKKILISGTIGAFRSGRRVAERAGLVPGTSPPSPQVMLRRGPDSCACDGACKGRTVAGTDAAHCLRKGWSPFRGLRQRP